MVSSQAGLSFSRHLAHSGEGSYLDVLHANGNPPPTVDAGSGTVDAGPTADSGGTTTDSGTPTSDGGGSAFPVGVVSRAQPVKDRPRVVRAAAPRSDSLPVKLEAR